MYQYEFVRIQVKQGLWSKKPTMDYQEVIEAYAQKGWRFKQIFAPGIEGYGTPKYFELIFEKEVEV